ncbi:3-isopropylmalate dehydratase small subunit [Candidatus Bathyarchaeota archaeon]|nr:3-isopropylmalate dehydratase small subunit [Candidatus Bathyarchaeota archaeon]
MEVSGKAVKFGDNVDTDVIIPGKYLVYTDPNELAKHAMEGVHPNFYEVAAEGVIVVAGRNFGCGSSREHAPIALKHANVKCVVAESFARIFFRNAINIGLPVLECPGISDVVEEGDFLKVDLENGVVSVVNKNRTIRGVRLPKFILEILEDGGLIEHVRRSLSR